MTMPVPDEQFWAEYAHRLRELDETMERRAKNLKPKNSKRRRRELSSIRSD